MTVHAIRAPGTCDVVVDLDPADVHAWTAAARQVHHALDGSRVELLEVEGVSANVEMPYFANVAEVIGT